MRGTAGPITVLVHGPPTLMPWHKQHEIMTFLWGFFGVLWAHSGPPEVILGNTFFFFYGAPPKPLGAIPGKVFSFFLIHLFSGPLDPLGIFWGPSGGVLLGIPFLSFVLSLGATGPPEALLGPLGAILGKLISFFLLQFFFWVSENFWGTSQAHGGHTKKSFFSSFFYAFSLGPPGTLGLSWAPSGENFSIFPFWSPPGL